jgi:hypothetical protein
MAARPSGAVGLARPRRPPLSLAPARGLDAPNPAHISRGGPTPVWRGRVPGVPPSSGAFPLPGVGAARPWHARAARPPAWCGFARGSGAVARCACPVRRGGVARPPAARRGLAPALLAVAAWLACPRPRRGSAMAAGARLGAWRGPRRPTQPRPARFARVARPRRRGVARPLASQLACGNPRGLLVAACSARGSPSATCSQQHLARVCSSGPQPRSLARVSCSPVQRLNVMLSHLLFVCELSCDDALHHLNVLVPIELYQEAAITRRGLILLR